MGDEDDGGQTRGETAQDIDEGKTALNGNPGMARAFRCKSDCHQASAYAGAVEKKPECDGDWDKNEQLHGNLVEEISLAKRDERIAETREIIDSVRDAFAQA